MLLFATDYPHWQFDGDDVLPAGLPERLLHKILIDNPLATYPRLQEAFRMTDTATTPYVPQARVNHRGIVDCDIHPVPATPKEMAEFLPSRWAKHLASYRRARAATLHRHACPIRA